MTEHQHAAPGPALPLAGCGCGSDHGAAAGCGCGSDHGAGGGCGCGGGEAQTGPLADASVRTARPTDAAAVGLVQASVWQQAYSQVLDPEVLEQLTGPRFASVWRSSLQSPPSPQHRLLVACAGAQVIGYVAIGPVEDEPGLEPGTGMVLDGGVHPEARGAGHGSRLLNAAVDTLRAAHGELSRVAVWTLADAEDARAFLQAAGFVPDGAWRDRVVSEDGRTARETRLVVDL